MKKLSEKLAERVERWPISQSNHPPFVPENDQDDWLDSTDSAVAEGQTFQIEYIDSKGVPSSRRITVWEIKISGSGHVSLFARCHERNAMRQFRIDRIKCCIDFDGEVHDDVPQFLEEAFGQDLFTLSQNNGSLRQTAIFERFSNHATLLVALSKLDGKFTEFELTEIASYLARRIERDTGPLSEIEIGRLVRYLRRLRPTPESISNAVMALADGSPDEKQELLRTAFQVARADGTIDESERLFLNDIAIDFLGTQIF